MKGARMAQGEATVMVVGPGEFLIEMNQAIAAQGGPDVERLREVCAKYESYSA
jgi:sarcosine oxidase gamma subunit